MLSDLIYEIIPPASVVGFLFFGFFLPITSIRISIPFTRVLNTPLDTNDDSRGSC